MTGDAEVGLEAIPEDNPFRHVVSQLRVDDEWAWDDIHEAMDEAYDAVDKAAFEEFCNAE